MLLLLATSVTFLEPITCFGNKDFVRVYRASAHEADPFDEDELDGVEEQDEEEDELDEQDGVEEQDAGIIMEQRVGCS